MVNGWKFYWKHHGWSVDGHPIQTVYFDTGSDPQQALTQAQKAVEQDHVQMVIGTFLASEALAVAPYLESQKVPFFVPASAPDPLTQQQASPYVLRIAGYTASQSTHAAAAWAYAQGYRRIVTVGPAYAYGYETVGGFAQVFTQLGGKIVKQLWNPLGTTFLTPYLSQIQSAHPDAVFAVEVGSDVGHFLEQYKSFGLQGRYPLIGTEDLTDPSSLVGIPASDSIGTYTVAAWAEGRQDPVTQNFDKAYEAAYGVIPSYNSAALYTAAEWLDQAFTSLKGSTSDTKKVLAAVRSVSLSDSPLGPMHLDAYGNPIENEYVRKAQAFPGNPKYGTVWNVVLKTYPAVSQFWTYSPKQYLKQPPYSVTFQGIQH